MTSYDPRPRVLVVDDEPSICRALTIALTRAGYNARALESGEAASELVRKEHFDCLIVDLRIPDMRGDTLFEIAAAVQPHLRRQTILTTGDISELAQELLDACHCPVLQKPFDLHDLLGMVAQMTGSRRRALG
jgi:DNA-binding NtrC family response regulator